MQTRMCTEHRSRHVVPMTLLAVIAAIVLALLAQRDEASAVVSSFAVRTSTVTVPASTANRYVKATFQVACAPGETPIGGGYRAGRGLVWMIGSYPSANAWSVVLTNEHPRRRSATIYAVCATP